MSFVNNHSSCVKINTPTWAKDAVIYQMNTRQLTPGGSLRAAVGHLDRIKQLGADIIWLMPVHETGRKRRKGKLGSPYSVRDYFSLDPSLGKLQDLGYFVDRAHQLGLHVILDWVSNHTSWDNKLINNHPSWYARDQSGEIISPPWTDWHDVAQLDYNNREVWEYMTVAMQWWVRQAGIDGFRADVAGFVPVAFWEMARERLERIKPVFMLAEWESAELHKTAFDASYAWDWWYAMRNIAKGQSDLEAIHRVFSWNENAYPEESMRMLFISNHDINSWEGTMYDNFGPALEPAIALSVAGKGIPLIYSGQEAGESKRLDFYNKDPIEWKEHEAGILYKTLFSFKKKNPAIWNGKWGAPMRRVSNNKDRQILSFLRERGKNKVFAVFNFSCAAENVIFSDKQIPGRYKELNSDYFLDADIQTSLKLKPWSFRLFSSGF